jgi:hypothetical protein
MNNSFLLGSDLSPESPIGQQLGQMNRDLVGQFALQAVAGGLPMVVKCLPKVAKGVATPYGLAVQSGSPEALSALEQVQNGATVYKGGVLGTSVTGDSQFLALENPLNPGYAGRYGIPPENADFNFILTGQVQTDASVITRAAPGLPPNPGGGIEAVTTPGSFQINSFHMP